MSDEFTLRPREQATLVVDIKELVKKNHRFSGNSFKCFDTEDDGSYTLEPGFSNLMTTMVMCKVTTTIDEFFCNSNFLMIPRVYIASRTLVYIV